MLIPSYVGAGAGSTSPGTGGCWRSSRARRCADSDRPMPPRRSRLAPRRCPSTTTPSMPRWRAYDPSLGAAGRRLGRDAPRRPLTGRGVHVRARGLPAWQQDYLAEALAIERPRFPSLERIADALGGHVRVEHVPTPGDCVDGFFEAFWRRPEALLDPEVRASQSIWTLLEPGVEQRIVDRLRDDLASRSVGCGPRTSARPHELRRGAEAGRRRARVAPARAAVVHRWGARPRAPTRRTASGASWPQLRRAQADLRG